MNGTRLPQVSVMIEFEQRGCDTILNCQQTFNTHIYEASIENSTGAARNVNNYQQVQRVLPVYTSGYRVSNETITINFTTNHSSFYVAVQDETTCMVITRLIIFYTVCPAQTANLIHYPETIASSLYEGLPNIISISAQCVENAQPENGLALLVTCSAEGIWASVPAAGAGCQCVPGYFREKFNDSELCSCKALITCIQNSYQYTMQC